MKMVLYSMKTRIIQYGDAHYTVWRQYYTVNGTSMKKPISTDSAVC